MQGLPLPSPTRRGPNSFIFMQFSAKSLQNNPFLGIGAPRNILDPPQLAVLGIIRVLHKYAKLALMHTLQWRIYIVKFWTRPPSPGGPNSFNFMQFLGKFGKIICWRPLPPPGSWRPLLGEILDPPLHCIPIQL